MIEKTLALIAKLFLGKGIDKKFPILVDLYKKVFQMVGKNAEVSVDIPLGQRLLVSTKDSGLGMFLRTKGEYEPLQTNLFIQTVKPGDIVFDIGANVGYYTLLASKLAGTKGKVYAFEPDPRTAALLNKNIKLNKCTNVTVVQSALSTQKGITTLVLDEANPGESSLANGKGKKITIQGTTLYDFIQQNKIKNIDVIKIDVEGAELEVLKGAQNSLTKNRGVMFIECNKKALQQFSESPKTLLNLLSTFGYQITKIVNEFNKKTYAFSSKRLETLLSKTSYVGIIAKK